MTRLYLVGWLLAATDGEYTLMALGALVLWGLTLGLALNSIARCTIPRGTTRVGPLRATSAGGGCECRHRDHVGLRAGLGLSTGRHPTGTQRGGRGGVRPWLR